jgi:hypothetical protein
VLLQALDRFAREARRTPKDVKSGQRRLQYMRWWWQVSTRGNCRQDLFTVSIRVKEDVPDSSDILPPAGTAAPLDGVHPYVDYVESERLTLTDVAKTARTR